MNILIVDDEPNARKTMGNILKAKGYEAEEAGTGSEAARSCKAKFFNLVLIDVRLPDMSGLEVLRVVRGINEDTIAIMMTGYASLDSSIEAMNKGAYSYLTKPLNMDAALTVIEKGFEKQRLAEALRISEESYRAIFESANDAIFIRDINTYEIVDANEKACEMFCYPREEIKGLSLGSLSTGSAQYPVEKLKSFYDKAAKEEPQLFEWLPDRPHPRKHCHGGGNERPACPVGPE